MTRITRAEAHSRLRSAITYELAPDTRQAHMTSIETALADLPLSDSATRPRNVRVRRWVVGLATAAASLSPVGVAVAAEQSLPGDTLYQAKLATETIRSVVDPLVSARHRISELEALMELEAESSTIRAALTAAWDSVEHLGSGHPLVTRLEKLDGQITTSEDAESLPGPIDDNLAPGGDQQDGEDPDELEPTDESEGSSDEPEDVDENAVDEDLDGETEEDSPSAGADDDDGTSAGGSRADDDPSEEDA